MIRLIDKYVQAMQGLRPLHCNLFGLDDLAAGIIVSGGLGALGSVVGAIGNRNAQKSANEQNLQIARENNATSLRIAHENNALQENMQEANNLFNQREAEKTRAFAQDMFNQENRYNSPIEQLKRYQMAGLNPAVAMTDAQAMAASGSVPSGASSSPAGISPTMPILTSPQMQPLPSVASSILDNLGKVADVALKVKQAEKTGADTKLLQDTMDDMVAKMHSDALSAEANSKYQQLTTELYQKYGDLKWNKELKKFDEEINNLIQSQYTASMTQDEISARIEQIMENTKLTRLQLPYAEEKAKLAKQFAEEELTAIRNGAESAVMNATASLKNASAAQVAANAAHMNAVTNEYLAKNPKDLAGYLIRAVEESGLKPAQVGQWVRSFVENHVNPGNRKSFLDVITEALGIGYSDYIQNPVVHPSQNFKHYRQPVRYVRKKK